MTAFLISPVQNNVRIFGYTLLLNATNGQTDIKHEKEKKKLAECQCWRSQLKSFPPRKDRVRKWLFSMYLIFTMKDVQLQDWLEDQSVVPIDRNICFAVAKPKKTENEQARIRIRKPSRGPLQDTRKTDDSVLLNKKLAGGGKNVSNVKLTTRRHLYPSDEILGTR